MLQVKPYIEKISKVNQARNQIKNGRKIKVPINDLQAWAEYQRWRFIYDRQKIAQFQNLYHAVMPIEPINSSKYPVILKPIINLYGMGHQSYLLNNSSDFNKKFGHTGFWMEYLTGDHYSYDLVLVNSKIVWWTCFKGNYLRDPDTGKQVHGVFNSWEHLGQKKLPDSILKLVKMIRDRSDKSRPVPNGGYYGCLNVECIGEKIIESHLRMGDLDQFEDSKLIKAIVQVYGHRGWSLPSNYQVSKSVHLFPIWGRKIISSRRIIRKIIKICQDYQLFRYLIEDGKGMAPPGRKRILLLTGLDYQLGLKGQRKIYRYLIEHNYI